ncbi:NnrS family protein [Stutzerimonas stutzeri]|uniref:NnrS family protein n=3 Tax=Stutzerimonas stutzeri TaxID=316 RepID=UPI000F7AF458|nr:NnrS family protein [Stutzerimonas stutzeri]MDH0212751.1 NnrS family protein [Stutzerimonas stutzeri]MDH0261306.1 NnrS family protein [Stutzerimonas stutzeri]MDH0503168.1 NnrS family protein [Stutzerimonas stutzeri]RRW20540.1 NnrS family protein [Stutzerimonas stutzeri]RRW26801.1 NnrS family protein [Stutzerimonas stutzeri]
MHPRQPRLPFANAWFFPVAALYAAFILPVSILALLGLIPAPPGLSTPSGHAHEMLFGFALAVVAGYLLGPQPLRLILSLLGCWALARLSFLLWPGSWLALASAATFAGGVAWKVLPRFFGAAKKWRNQSVAPLLAGLALLSAMAGNELGVAVERLLLVEALLLFATLMAFMGGRIIAPAMAGYAQSEGRRLDARVQPGLEGAVLILLGLAFVLNPLPWPLLRQLAAALVISAGVLSAIRLLRWQPWRCARADLLILLLGYAWLAFGLLLLGLGLLLPALSLSATLHALSVGALGSLTFAVMARTRLLYRFRDPAARPWIQAMALLISLAALARVVPALLALPQRGWLLIAAGCWSLAFLSLALLLWQCRAAHVDSPRAQPDR